MKTPTEENQQDPSWPAVTDGYQYLDSGVECIFV